MEKIRIPSLLYRALYERGGDKLIATYCILKKSRTSEKYLSYKAKNNKKVSGYSLLRRETNISLHSLKRYVPELIKLKIAWFDDNGDFVLLGNEKTKKIFQSYKLAPICIGKNLIETSHYAVSVRIHSEIRQQERMIAKKQDQRDLQRLYRKLDQYPNMIIDGKTRKKLAKLQLNDIELTDKPVISNKGYALIKNGVRNNKPMGVYWKRVLKRKGVVSSSRRFRLIRPIDHFDYLSLKGSGDLNRKLTYFRGHLAEELVATVTGASL